MTMKCNVFDIWMEYETKLRNYIRKRVQNSHDAEDILHTVLLNVHRYCEKKSNVKNLNAWLHQVCFHAIVDHYKHNARFESLNPMQLHYKTPQSSADEATEWVERLLPLLPEKYAEPLKMADLEGLKQQEVADKKSLSLSATKSRIQRGRKKLRSRFEECGIIEKDGERLLFTVTKPCCKKLLAPLIDSNHR